jgi:vacuolar-type H+-ATPase subunit E/Vma4
MDENDVPYVMNALKVKSAEMFQQSIMYEAKLQRQNDIIGAQQNTIEELKRAHDELAEQLKNIDTKKSVTRKSKSVLPEKDGGTF